MSLVKISCKHPHGLVLHANNKMVKLNGFAAGRSGAAGPGGYAHAPGIAITEVDDEFMAAWFRENAESPLIQNGVVAYAA